MTDPDLFTYPQHPGWKRTDTSLAAATAVKFTANTLRASVLHALRAYGNMTADECAELLRADKLSIRPRFSELHNMGKIRDTGDRKKNASGRSAIVWRIA